MCREICTSDRKNFLVQLRLGNQVAISGERGLLPIHLCKRHLACKTPGTSGCLCFYTLFCCKTFCLLFRGQKHLVCPGGCRSKKPGLPPLLPLCWTSGEHQARETANRHPFHVQCQQTWRGGLTEASSAQKERVPPAAGGWDSGLNELESWVQQPVENASTKSR